MQFIDQPKTGRFAILSPELAVVSGKIKTDSIDDLRRFERAFPFDPRAVIAVAQDVLERENVSGKVSPDKAQRLLTPKEKSDIVFKELLPRVYRPGAAPGWTSDLYFNIEGAGDYTVSVKPDGVRVAEGKVGDPDANVAMDAGTFAAVMRFEALDDSGQLDEVNVVDDEGRSEELSDDQLELVAGGKGETAAACGAEACGGDACAGAACGAAAAGGGACAGAACATDVGGAGVCAGAACGAAAGGAGACAGDACGGAACGAAAGAGSGCGAAACGAAACAGDFCGAAACPAAACAGAVCGADVAPGPDIGPCAINVIPLIPFI